MNGFRRGRGSDDERHDALAKAVQILLSAWDLGESVLLVRLPRELSEDEYDAIRKAIHGLLSEYDDPGGENRGA